VRLENYLIEYKEILTPEKANKIIRTKCSDYYNHALNGYYLYRGVEKIAGPILIDPSKRLRKSLSYGKPFMDMVDNFPEWKDYPKRSRALMLSTSATHANMFATKTGMVCTVFPFDGSRLAVCPTKDFNMGTFMKGFQSIGVRGGMVHMSDTLEDLYELIFEDKLDFDQNVYPQLVNLSKEIERRKKEEDWIYDLAAADMPVEFKAALRSESLMSILQRIVSPKSGGFKLAETNEYIKGDHEVWTDGKCVIMPRGTLKGGK
jgi:hypothetical protein